MKWFRLYHSMLDSLKVRTLPTDAQMDYVLLLCCASEYRERTHDNGGQTGLTVAAAKWRTRSATLEGTFPTLLQASLATLDSAGLIVIPDWSAKQFNSDDITARTLKSKGNKKGNVPRNVGGHVRDTDTDTDTDKACKKPLPKGFAVSERVERWAQENGHSLLAKHLEHFVQVAMARGYKYTDWDSAFMRAVRENWAKVPVKAVLKVSL